MSVDLVTKKLARFEALKAERRLIDDEYDDLARVLHPRRVGFQSDLAPGDIRTDHQFDSTPALARAQLATSMEGFVTPKGGNAWLKIESEDEDLMEVHEARSWFEAATNKVFAAIYDPQAGFHKAAGAMYDDIATFGPGPFSVFERPNVNGTSTPSFRSVHLKDFYWSQNEWGEADTFYVVWNRTVAAVASLYGVDNMSDKAKDLLRQDKLDAKVKLLHVVEPRGGRDHGRSDNLNMPYASYVIDIDGKKIMEEKGFNDLPYLVPVWGDITGEPWGWSPGRLLLPDVKMLNQQARTTMEVGHFVARPPMLTPHEGVLDYSAVHPGAWVHYDAQAAAANGGRPPITPLNIGANYPVSRELTQDTRDRIWQGFLRNVLSLPVDAPSMTATEIIERKEEMMRVVGPVFGRLETDFTQKLVRRVFWILFRSGALPPPPEILGGAGLKYTVNSPFTAVRKQIEAASVTRVAEIIGPLAANNPEMLDHYDTDRIARDVGMSMLPTDWVRPLEGVQALREQRAQQQKAAAEREQMMQMAQVAKDVTPAVKMLEGEAV